MNEMEKNIQQDDVSFYDNEASEKADLDLEKATITHEFSSPWDDSDLVLVVEDQKLHVHRSILKMASPVFKAMLSSNFKEKDAKEIPLPGKKVDEFVDFLRQIYPQFDSEITLENIRYIYSLADEYQMTKVMKNCRLFLLSVRKTKENAMNMLRLAQDLEAEEARQQCYDVLKKMSSTELEKAAESFSELDRQSMQVLLVPMVKRLQQCVKKIVPEFLGSLDGMMCLWTNVEYKKNMGGAPKSCPKHRIDYGYFKESLPDIKATYERIKCDDCRVMFRQMAENSTRHFKSPSCMYLSANILSVLEEMMDLIKEQ